MKNANPELREGISLLPEARTVRSHVSRSPKVFVLTQLTRSTQSFIPFGEGLAFLSRRKTIKTRV